MEGGVVLVGVVALAAVIWGGLAPVELRRYPLAFVAIPPLLWAAYRFGRREAAWLLVVLAAMAVYGTLRGFGPFAPLPPRHTLLVLQSFMATMALMTLVVACLALSRGPERSPLQTITRRLPGMITM